VARPRGEPTVEREDRGAHDPRTGGSVTAARFAEIAADSSGAAFVLAAAAVGFVHTLAGPDHNLPFVAMAKARGWKWRKTLVVTLACGVGHVLSSLLLAAGGVALGASFEVAAGKVAGLADARATFATWLLIAFGLLYTAWGLKKAARSHAHVHPHAHADGTVHAHEHVHEKAHVHPHVALAVAATRGGGGAAKAGEAAPRRSITPWLLFTLFVFGPCEPLLPLVLAPQVAGNRGVGVAVVVAFTLATLVAMVAAVFVGVRSLSFATGPRFATLARYQHALAGAMVLGCGVAMKFGL
jgi:nickel/cobalt exporter